MPHMAEYRISHINLDDETILWRSADVEQERRVAMFDLIEENTFKPVRSADAGHDGPYQLQLSVPEGRLSLVISDSDGNELETLLLGLARFRRPIREYFAICDSYYQAIRQATAAEIETMHLIGCTPSRVPLIIATEVLILVISSGLAASLAGFGVTALVPAVERLLLG